MNKTILSSAIDNALTVEQEPDEFQNIRRLATLAKINNLPDQLLAALKESDHEAIQDLIDFYGDIIISALLEEFHKSEIIDLKRVIDDYDD